VAGTDDGDEVAQLSSRVAVLLDHDEEDLRDRPLSLRCLVELLGTFLLTLVAGGSGVINAYVGSQEVSRAAAVIAPGALVMAFIYAWGPLSGLHINPAVTLGFAARGAFRRAWVPAYLAAQIVGAVVAALFLQAMFGHVAAGGTYPDPTAGNGRAFVMEVVLTAILVSVILGTATGWRSVGHNAAIAVGATIALLGLFASPISGASMNPARSLGPDIVANDYRGWWVYLAGPLLGSAIAVVTMFALRGRPVPHERAAAEGGALPLSP
jgi:aquaporin Z